MAWGSALRCPGAAGYSPLDRQSKLTAVTNRGGRSMSSSKNKVFNMKKYLSLVLCVFVLTATANTAQAFDKNHLAQLKKTRTCIKCDLSNLSKAQGKLGNVNLSRANLSNAYLLSANLRWANLEGANLHGANLDGADLAPYLTGAKQRGIRQRSERHRLARSHTVRGFGASACISACRVYFADGLHNCA